MGGPASGFFLEVSGRAAFLEAILKLPGLCWLKLASLSGVFWQ